MSTPVIMRNFKQVFDKLDAAVEHGAIELLVMHHKSCLDGWGSLAALKFQLEQYIDLHHINLHVIECPYDYKYVLNEIHNLKHNYMIEPDIVFSLDWSPDETILEYCRNRFKCPVMIIDHHDDNRTDLYNNYELCSDVGVYFDNSHSGAVLTYKFFNEWKHISTDVPMILNHIEDRDLWKFNIPNTKEICTALYFLNDESVDAIVNVLFDASPLLDLIATGEVMVKYRDSITKSFAKNYTIHSWKGRDKSVRFAYVECDSKFVSDVADMIIKQTSVDFVVCQHHDLPKADYKIGLRSINKVDFPVNLLAMKFTGGGGHAGAAGFTIKEPVDLRVIGHLMTDIISNLPTEA